MQIEESKINFGNEKEILKVIKTFFPEAQNDVKRIVDNNKVNIRNLISDITGLTLSNKETSNNIPKSKEIQKHEQKSNKKNQYITQVVDEIPSSIKEVIKNIPKPIFNLILRYKRIKEGTKSLDIEINYFNELYRLLDIENFNDMLHILHNSNNYYAMLLKAIETYDFKNKIFKEAYGTLGNYI